MMRGTTPRAVIAIMLLGCRVSAFAPRGLGHPLGRTLPRTRSLTTTSKLTRSTATTTTTSTTTTMMAAADEEAVVAAAREVAVAAARSTGDEVRRGMGADIAQTKSNFRDLLTEVGG